MNSIKKIRLILTLCSLLIASVSVNAQVVIKDCGGGVTVGGNDSCPSSSRPGYNAGGGGLVHKWGAIAIDVSNNHQGWGFDYSPESQKNASILALWQCEKRSSHCEVVSEFRNTCSAIAYADGQGSDWIWAVGNHINADDAERVALSNCKDKTTRGHYGKCNIAVPAMCIGTPGKLSNSK